MSLSLKNNWVDNKNRVYIYYTVKEVMEELNIAREKCSKIFAELDTEKGCGLITKVRQGLGKPDIIYVMKISSCLSDDNSTNDADNDYQDEYEARENSASEEEISRNSKIETLEVRKSNPLKFENQNYRNLKIKSPEIRKSKTNNNDFNNNKNNNTDFSDNNLILSYQQGEESKKKDAMDEMREREKYRELISENIEYEILVKNYSQSSADDVLETMLDAVCSTRDYFWIGEERIPQAAVKSRLLKLDYGHIEYALDKVLLTGTPIEKNILDLYGLMYFIDETILPSEQEYMAKYFRKPENYPELAKLVGKYCFRTLRKQAKRCAFIPERIVITCEFEQSPEEQKLYNLLQNYIDKPNKIAFPEMEKYDLALMLFGAMGSSTPAIIKSIEGIIKRLEKIPGAAEELKEFTEMLLAAHLIKTDTKLKLLTEYIEELFKLLKKAGANRKAVIFTESRETQSYLAEHLKDKYKMSIYNGSKNYREIESFKTENEIIISTDQGSRGFNMEDAALVINYDLLYNTLKMEQRIDRCHRLNQQNDVIVLNFLNKSNMADVRKLELVNKRMLVADGVFGMSDNIEYNGQD